MPKKPLQVVFKKDCAIITPGYKIANFATEYDDDVFDSICRTKSVGGASWGSELYISKKDGASTKSFEEAILKLVGKKFTINSKDITREA